jgi:hypothetical protein
MTTPTTLREKYMQERERLYDLVSKLDDAIISLASGSVASYSLGNRSCTYADIDKLKTLRHEAEDRIDELEAILRGASPRSVQVSTFLDPSFIVPRW